MKTIFTLVFLAFNYISNAQFEGSWYTFRIDDMLCTTITKDKLITSRISNFKTPEQYIAKIDTFTIKESFFVNDSILYIITNSEPDDLKFDSKKLQLHKFVYNKHLNTLTTFYYYTLKKFYDFQSTIKDIKKKDIEKFIANDTSNEGYITYYTEESVDTFLAYPKLIDQPADIIIKLYNNLTLIYSSLHQKTEEEKMPYYVMKGLSKSVIESPSYLELKVCPLVEPENFEEIEIMEKFEDNKAVIEALYKYRATR